MSAAYYTIKWYHNMNDLPDPTNTSFVSSMVAFAAKVNVIVASTIVSVFIMYIVVAVTGCVNYKNKGGPSVAASTLRGSVMVRKWFRSAGHEPS